MNFNNQKEKNYIYMKDILKKAPFKLNYKCKKAFILYNSMSIQKKGNEIILNIKILINNKELIIPIWTNDNHLSITNLLNWTIENIHKQKKKKRKRN